jgi:hypothetical protein
LEKNYYKRYWDETTGEELTDSWGTSTYYFESDMDNIVLRQIQVFENGIGLKYWNEFTEDNCGALSDQRLDANDFEQYKIDKVEFEKIWAADYKKIGFE